MTRRPVLPGASELFRRTDVPAAQPAPVTELPTLAATQASPALRSAASRDVDPAGMRTKGFDWPRRLVELVHRRLLDPARGRGNDVDGCMRHRVASFHPRCRLPGATISP